MGVNGDARCLDMTMAGEFVCECIREELESAADSDIGCPALATTVQSVSQVQVINRA